MTFTPSPSHTQAAAEVNHSGYFMPDFGDQAFTHAFRFSLPESGTNTLRNLAYLVLAAFLK